MYQLATFVMRGLGPAILTAGLFGALSHKILILAPFSAAWVALYLMRKGALPGLHVAAATAAITLLAGMFLQTRPGLNYPVLLFLLPPVYLGAWLLRVYAEQGIALTAIALCAAVAALGVEIFSGDAVTWWGEWLKMAIRNVPDASYEGFEVNNSLVFVNGLAAMLLGMAGSGALLLGRWLQALLYNPGGFRDEFQTLRIPTWVAPAWIVVTIILGAIKSNFAYDLGLVGAMLYFFQGMAILHYSAARAENGRYYLIPPYVLLFIMPQFVIVGFACVGLTDPLINYRKFVKSRR